MRVEGESEMRELFHRLKEEDKVSAPSFSETLNSRQRTCGLAGGWSFRLKLAVSLLAVVVFVVPILIHLNQDSVEPAEELAVDVLEWESPTDFLLTFSEQKLWTTLPAVDTEFAQWVESTYEE